MPPTYTLLVGGYTQKGLSVIRFIPDGPGSDTQLALQPATVPAGSNTSWIATVPGDPTRVFTINENEDGRLLALKLSGLDGEGSVTGEIVSDVTSGGHSPAHFKVLPDEIVVGNYMGGSILSVPLSQSPFALKPVDLKDHKGAFVAFEGKGPNADRQESPHPHEVYEHGGELFVPDLGSDKTWRLKKGSSGQWQVAGSIDYAAGAGPRHILIHGGLIYTVLELSSQLSVHTLPPAGEPAQHLASLSTFAAGCSPDPENMLAAEILLSPTGSHIYVSNRNDPDPAGDTLAVYTVPKSAADVKDGFKLVKEIRTGLTHARGVGWSKDGKYLAVAGAKSHALKIFEPVVGSQDGDLKEVASVKGLESPNAVAWL